MKKYFALLLLSVAVLSFAVVKYDRRTHMPVKRVDAENANSKEVFSGTVSDTFDKSANGYGWYWSNSKRVQTNMDPVTGPMIGSIYRRLDATYGFFVY